MFIVREEEFPISKLLKTIEDAIDEAEKYITENFADLRADNHVVDIIDNDTDEVIHFCNPGIHWNC